MCSLAKSTAIYTIGRLLPQVANFILLPVYTSYLTPDEYGIVESMLVLGIVLSIFLSMATERSMFRLYYDYRNDVAKKLFVGNVFLLIVLFSSIIIVCLFLFGDLVGKIYSSIDFNPYYVYTIISSFCISFSVIPLTLFQVKSKALNFVFLNVSIFIVNTLLIVLFVVVMKQGPDGYLKGKMIANIVLLPISLGIILKHSIVKFNVHILKNILSFSTPMIPGLIMAWVLNMSNRIFIEQYYSLDEVGIYSLAFKISSLGSIILAALFTAYNPVFYKIANEANANQAIAILRKMNNLIIVIVFVVAGVIALFAGDLIEILFNVHYYVAGQFIPIILLSILFVQLAGLLNLMIYQQKKTYLVTIVSVVGAVMSIGLNFIFVPLYGMWGATYASVLTAFTMFVLEYIFASKAYFISMPILKILSSLVALAIIIYVGNYLLPKIIWLRLVVKITLVVLVGVFFHKTIREKVQFVLKDM